MAIATQPLPWQGRRGARLLNKGKTQLRSDAEAKAYVAAALAQDTPERRAGAVLPLLIGLRSGELRHVRPIDVDLLAGAIWIREHREDRQLKTESPELKILDGGITSAEPSDKREKGSVVTTKP